MALAVFSGREAGVWTGCSFSYKQDQPFTEACGHTPHAVFCLGGRHPRESS